jgi:hypothetical protein
MSNISLEDRAVRIATLSGLRWQYLAESDRERYRHYAKEAEVREAAMRRDEQPILMTVNFL